MTELENEIERLRRHIEKGFTPDSRDVRVLLAEYGRINAELDRLTTPQNSEHVSGEPVLIWKFGRPFCVQRTTLPGEKWTPLPTPKEAPCEKPVCTLCNGSGETPIMQDHGGVMDGQPEQYEPCSLCQKEGKA